MQNLNVPFGFLANKTGEATGAELGDMFPASRRSSRTRLTSLCLALDIRLRGEYPISLWIFLSGFRLISYLQLVRGFLRYGVQRSIYSLLSFGRSVRGSTFGRLSTTSFIAKSACDRAVTSASRKSMEFASLKTKEIPRQPGLSSFTRCRSRSGETDFAGGWPGTGSWLVLWGKRASGPSPSMAMCLPWMYGHHMMALYGLFQSFTIDMGMLGSRNRVPRTERTGEI